MINIEQSDEKLLLKLSQQISKKVRKALVQRLMKTGYTGDTLLDPKDLKSNHEIDLTAKEVIIETLKEYNIDILYESKKDKEIIKKDGSRLVAIIDEIDGSLNWDRGVGDPAIVIAVSEKKEMITYKDLFFAYAKGLISKDSIKTIQGIPFVLVLM